MRGIDYFATQTPEFAKCAKQEGFDFVARYYDADPTGPKCLDKAEVEGLLAAGMAIVPVFETTGGAPGYVPWGDDYFTRYRGQIDGREALARATEVGQPAGTPIYFAVDYDARNMDLLTDYFNGVWDSMAGAHPLGVYGSYAVCEHARAWPGVPYRWQTRAWSGGNVSEGIHLLQDDYATVCGVQCDVNEAYEDPAWRVDKQGEPSVTDEEFLALTKKYITPTIEAMKATYDPLVKHTHTTTEPQEK